MKENNYMSISEFAAITGIKRANLIFYDQIGLLSPEHRGENKYRYYSQRQIGTAYLISELREIGIGIQEIKRYEESRTPESMVRLFEMQEKRLQEEIEKLKRLKGMMGLYMEMAAEVAAEDLETIRVVEKQKEPIFLGLPTTNDKEDVELQKFYDRVMTQNMESCYPLGVIITPQNLMQGRYAIANQFYMRIPFTTKDYKPAGRYVTGYIKSDYGKAGALYIRLMQFIEDNQLTICGNAYEECPLNEISIKNVDDYIAKVEIQVV